MRSRVMAYAVGLAALAAAVLLRWLLDPMMGDSLPLVTLFGAIAAAVWVGGYRPAILVTLLGYVACAYLFIARGRGGFGTRGDIVGLIAYLFTCALIVGFGEAMRIAQAGAAERQETLRVTLSSIGDAVLTTGIDSRITYVNSVAESLTGWKYEDAVGLSLDKVFRIMNEETRLPIESPAGRALREGIVVGLANHTLLIRKDGVEIPIDDSAAPIRNERGEVSGCVLIFRNVTWQRRQELNRASQFSDARILAAIVESSDDAIVGKSLEGIIQSWNASAQRLFGYTAEQAVGRHISLIIPPERIAEEDLIIASLKAGLRIDHFETERLRSDGQRILVSLTISPIKDEDGNVIGASKIVRDVTRQRQAEEQARQLLVKTGEANAKFRAFFEQGALFAAIMDVDGTILEPNRLSWEGCGYTREQILGKPIWEGPWWTPSASLVEQIKQATAHAASGQTFRAEMPYFSAGGAERIADVTIQPIHDETSRVLFLAFTGTDITERKQAEADRERFVTVIESSTDFIGICDLQGIPFFVNRSGLESVGLESIEQARATPVRDFFFPEDQTRIMEEFFPAVLQMGHGEIEVRFRHFKTGEARWMTYKVVALKNTEGKSSGFATVSHDVTERKHLEDNLRRLAAELSEANRRKDEFLAMLAHELRNPLAPISNAVQVLQVVNNGPNAIQSASEMLERQVAQMSRLVDDLLDISRITRGKIELRRQRVELTPILNQAIEANRALYKSMDHELTLSLPKQPIYLQADSARLAQIVGNLLNNACKFTDKGGQIQLNVEREADVTVIRVRDNGIGIAAEHLPRLFEMFTQVDTSLERSHGGLGLGLTLVKTLVEMHGGTVQVHSDGIGLGSEFTLRLPIAIDLPKSESAVTPEKAASAAGRRILIVDDNADGAESLAILLSLDGHVTHTAHDGLEAVEAAEQFRPEAMLLDIGLPKLNGYEVCRRIREQPWGKDLVMVALTGWGQEEDRHKSIQAGFNSHMVKPVDHEALLRLLASLPPGRRPS